jgi:hypothetical protein
MRQTRAPLSKDLHQVFVPFRSLTARGDADLELDDVYTFAQAERIAGQLPPPTSTRDTIVSWLNDEQRAEQPPEELLLEIIHHDIVDLVEVIRVSLADFENQSISLLPLQLQEHALYWRPLFGRFQIELRQLLRQLPAFVTFLYAGQAPVLGSSSPIPESSRKLLREALSHTRDTLELVNRAYTSLRAELQIAEARRSIEEAESIAKLTELAFIFIPLTFAASLFSMQVKELQPAPPVWFFIATAVAFIGFAYVIRLIARSLMIKQQKRRMLTSIRKYSDVSEGAHPTTRQYFGWFLSRPPVMVGWLLTDFGNKLSLAINYIASELTNYSIIVVVAGVLTTPLVFFWRRGFDTGYSVIITLFLLPMDLTLLWVLGSSLLYGKWKSKIQPARKPRRPRSVGSSVRPSNVGSSIRRSIGSIA